MYHNDETLFTQQRNGTIKTWNIEKTGYVVDATIDTNYNGFCRFQCALNDQLLFMPNQTNEILVYDLKSNNVQHTLVPSIDDKNEREEPTQIGLIMCLRYFQQSNQSYLLAGYESGHFITWNLRTNSIMNVTKFNTDCPITFDYCSETNRGIYGNESDKLGIFGYNRNEMKLINRGDISIKNAGINCIKIRKDRKIFCAGGWDGRVRIYSWKSLRPLAVLTDHKASITDIAYSNEKVDLWKAPIMATASSDGQIALWNIYN